MRGPRPPCTAGHGSANLSSQGDLSACPVPVSFLLLKCNLLLVLPLPLACVAVTASASLPVPVSLFLCLLLFLSSWTPPSLGPDPDLNPDCHSAFHSPALPCLPFATGPQTLGSLLSSININQTRPNPSQPNPSRPITTSPLFRVSPFCCRALHSTSCSSSTLHPLSISTIQDQTLPPRWPNSVESWSLSVMVLAEKRVC